MIYTVGEMAKLLGVAPSTLRYYDKEGILPYVERTKSGIRMFSERDYEWLKIVECLKKSGLSISDIKSYKEMIERGDESIKERFELFNSRREAVAKQMEELKEQLELLELKCWYYETAMAEGTAKRVLSLSVDELPEQYREAKRKIILMKEKK